MKKNEKRKQNEKRLKKCMRACQRLIAVGAMGVVFQAASCQATGEQLFTGLLTTAIANAINAFVFGQFNLTP